MRRLLGVLLLCSACGDDTGPPDARSFDGPPAGGTFSLSWSITDPDAAPLSCGEVGAGFVSLTIRPEDQPFGVTDVLTCTNGEGASRTLDPGSYRVSIALTGVESGSVELDGVEIESGQDTPLGAVVFVVDPRGGFTFQIEAGAGNNCTDAGITGTLLELATVGGDCVPVTFDVAAGASSPASTYTTDCDAPAPHACIEDDQQITVAPTVPADTYRLRITGLVGDAPCWARQPQFAVPAGGESANLGDQALLLDDANPACAP